MHQRDLFRHQQFLHHVLSETQQFSIKPRGHNKCAKHQTQHKHHITYTVYTTNSCCLPTEHVPLSFYSIFLWCDDMCERNSVWRTQRNHGNEKGDWRCAALWKYNRKNAAQRSRNDNMCSDVDANISTQHKELKQSSFVLGPLWIVSALWETGTSLIRIGLLCLACSQRKYVAEICHILCRKLVNC